MNCYNRNVLLRIFNLTFACIHRDGWIGHKVPVHIYIAVYWCGGAIHSVAAAAAAAAADFITSINHGAQLIIA